MPKPQLRIPSNLSELTLNQLNILGETWDLRLAVKDFVCKLRIIGPRLGPNACAGFLKTLLQTPVKSFDN